RDGIAHLGLDRPHVMNAIDDDVCRDLVRQLEVAEADASVRALVLSGGGGKAFSAGADIKHMRTLSSVALRRFVELTWRTFERLAASPLPSVAALHGYVLGGGMEL